jgi:hypothetical protein
MDVAPRPPSPWDLRADDFPVDGTRQEQLRFLIRYALLAPSTRNTQPWTFVVGPDVVAIHLDTTRWQPVADPDQREMFISLGCALENLLIAATHFGYRTAADYLAGDDDSTPVVRIRFEGKGRLPSSPPDPRFKVMTHRHTHHGSYDGTPVEAEHLAALSDACTEPGLRVHWITGDDSRAQVDALVMRADAVLLSNPEYRHELGELIGSGVFGTPWLLAALGRFAVSHLISASSFSQADHDALMSSPVIGVICAHSNSRQSQVRVGQVLERIYLAATIRGLSLQPVSQLLQLPETAEALARMLPDQDCVPLQPFRLGHAPPPRVHTPRRSLEEVLR